jgi:hypothetical protein
MINRPALLWLITVGLTSCGGGGGGGEPPNEVPRRSAEGLWVGTTNTARSVVGLVTSDGSAWFFYSTPNEPDRLGGVIQAHGASLNGSFSSGNARDVNAQEDKVRAATLSASYTPLVTLAGSFSYSFSETVSFTTAYGPAYDNAPDPTVLAGRYTGLAVTRNAFSNVVFEISAFGVITGTLRSCTFAGNASARRRANVYDASITFADGSCGFDALSGLVFFDAANNRLYFGALNAQRDDGLAFALSHP